MGVSRRPVFLGALVLALTAACGSPADRPEGGAGEAATPSATPAATPGDQGGSDGGGDGPVTSGGGGSGGGGGGPGSGVVGSPIRMPGFQQKGAEIVTVYDGLVAEIAAACGPGGLCVEIVVESEDGRGPESTCGFDGTRPAEGELLERGSTVVFLTTPRCSDLVGTDETAGGTGAGDPGTDEGDEIEGGGTSDTRSEVSPEESTAPSTPLDDPSP